MLGKWFTFGYENNINDPKAMERFIQGDCDSNASSEEDKIQRHGNRHLQAPDFMYETRQNPTSSSALITSSSIMSTAEIVQFGVASHQSNNNTTANIQNNDAGDHSSHHHEKVSRAIELVNEFHFQQQKRDERRRRRRQLDASLTSSSSSSDGFCSSDDEIGGNNNLSTAKREQQHKHKKDDGIFNDHEKSEHLRRRVLASLPQRRERNNDEDDVNNNNTSTNSNSIEDEDVATAMKLELLEKKQKSSRHHHILQEVKPKNRDRILSSLSTSFIGTTRPALKIWKNVDGHHHQFFTNRMAHSSCNIDNLNLAFVFGGIVSNSNSTTRQIVSDPYFISHQKKQQGDPTNKVINLIPIAKNDENTSEQPIARYGSSLVSHSTFVFLFGGTDLIPHGDVDQDAPMMMPNSNNNNNNNNNSSLSSPHHHHHGAHSATMLFNSFNNNHNQRSLINFIDHHSELKRPMFSSILSDFWIGRIVLLDYDDNKNDDSHQQQRSSSSSASSALRIEWTKAITHQHESVCFGQAVRLRSDENGDDTGGGGDILTFGGFIERGEFGVSGDLRIISIHHHHHHHRNSSTTTSNNTNSDRYVVRSESISNETFGTAPTARGGHSMIGFGGTRSDDESSTATSTGATTVKSNSKLAASTNFAGVIVYGGYGIREGGDNDNEHNDLLDKQCNRGSRFEDGAEKNIIAGEKTDDDDADYLKALNDLDNSTDDDNNREIPSSTTKKTNREETFSYAGLDDDDDDEDENSGELPPPAMTMMTQENPQEETPHYHQKPLDYLSDCYILNFATSIWRRVDMGIQNRDLKIPRCFHSMCILKKTRKIDTDKSTSSSSFSSSTSQLFTEQILIIGGETRNRQSVTSSLRIELETPSSSSSSSTSVSSFGKLRMSLNSADNNDDDDDDEYNNNNHHGKQGSHHHHRGDTSLIVSKNHGSMLSSIVFDQQKEESMMNLNFLRNEDTLTQHQESTLLIVGGSNSLAVVKNNNNKTELTSAINGGIHHQQPYLSTSSSIGTSNIGDLLKSKHVLAEIQNANAVTSFKQISNTFFYTEEAETSLHHMLQHQPPMLRSLSARWLAMSEGNK